ncbi:hypothetical protein PIB30_065240 [Stylosanthes scabra]|uniref:Uncharacterized protein n=1 Tax=Stylosanthes scabra TaxID=79078 RepID=A0ABU6YLE5_9FABA|nr:hypothetical protein [Stylosanthes scabra]
MMQTEHLPHTPSFSSYSSSETFAQIAARVIHELQQDPLYSNDLLLHHEDTLVPSSSLQNDDEFEFSLVSRDPASSPVSADDIFHNGHIAAPTCYPLFGRHVLLNGVVSDSSPLLEKETTTVPAPARRRLPLRALMLEEREISKKNNELEGVPEESYCVWTPQSCKKSSSAGSTSSRRWKLRDLLLRSHSDGKEPIQFHNNNSNEKEGGERSKRRLFLPYRYELLGLFGNNNNNNGVGRDSQPSSNPN